MEQHGDRSSSSHVLETPVWILALRGVQFLISLVILGLAGRLIHDLYLDEFGFSVATAVLTWCVLFYVIFTERIPNWQRAYHILAVLILEAFMVIMWLATFAAVAARRARFVVPVTLNNCFDDGSAVNSKTCFRKRALQKRAYLFKSGEDMMSAIAGLGALLWLMFIATCVWTVVMFLRGRKEGRFPIGGGASSSDNFQMEPKAEQAAPMMQQQQQPIQAQQNGEYQQSPLAQNPTPVPYQPAQSPYQQQPPYQPPQDNQYTQYPQQYPSYQQGVHQGSELSGTPHPQQQYPTPSPGTASPPPQQPYYQQPQQPQQHQQ